MKTKDYLKLLVEQIHSTTVATIGEDNHPQTRIIDMMLYDEEGLYFLTAKGKAFYEQLIKQQYVALSGTKDKKSITLRGKVKNIKAEKLDEIFEKNTYMQKLYPQETRTALEVFCLYEGEGEYFDISNPLSVVRSSFALGKSKLQQSGYFVTEGCIGCKLCYSVCPQKCIDISKIPVVIEQEHCLRCGSCYSICPKQVIRKRG